MQYHCQSLNTHCTKWLDQYQENHVTLDKDKFIHFNHQFATFFQ